VLVVGGVLAALGAYGFIYNVWRTIDVRTVRLDPPVVIVPR
jgi:hypothetical protein